MIDVIVFEVVVIKRILLWMWSAAQNLNHQILRLCNVNFILRKTIMDNLPELICFSKSQTYLAREIKQIIAQNLQCVNSKSKYLSNIETSSHSNKDFSAFTQGWSSAIGQGSTIDSLSISLHDFVPSFLHYSSCFLQKNGNEKLIIM